MKSSRHSLSLRPLAACLALVFGAPEAGAVPPHTAVMVQNCLDHGTGSLRQAVIDNITSAPIDLTQLACSSITLTTGSIDVNRALLIQGPGPDALTIDGAGLDRVFRQLSTQTLALYGMTIQNGFADAFGGGCVYSAGSLQLNETRVRGCHVSDIASTVTTKGGGVLVHNTFSAVHSSIVDNENYSALGKAYGGGAFVQGAAILDHSTISGNVLSKASDNIGSAGGIEVYGALNMMYSTIANNSAQGSPGHMAGIGGLRVMGVATITQSTISGNHTDGGVGGVYLFEHPGTPHIIIDSTISGNSAYGIGGIRILGPSMIKNSTIAFNAEYGSTGGAGLYVSFGNTDIESTIIAANTSAGGTAQNVGVNITASLSGANNLIGSSPMVTLPPGTIGGDPLLLPLANNGGPTKTHALRPGSPAENAGNATSGASADQRGAGYPRVVGTAADIGAFEGIDTDTIFDNGFD
ncbi:MAG: choice-of-anchor Q domain-containing protein [Dokdonella sp.]